MEETNFVLLWKEHYEKIDQSLMINKRLLKEIINQKARSALRSLTRLKVIGIVADIIWLLLLGSVLFYAFSHYTPAANYFIISMLAIFIINIKALYDYIKHLVVVNNINYDGNVLDIQQKLIKLQLSVLQHTRIMFLQLPFWSTFYLSSKWFPQSVGWGFIIFQVLFTIAFIFIAWWLYKNIRPENLHKKWVRALIGGGGGKQIANALQFYNEISEFEKNN